MHILTLHIGNMRNSFICICPEDQNLFHALHGTICTLNILCKNQLEEKFPNLHHQVLHTPNHANK